jgi:nitrite reductase/ring-hydroxylating ferredoxin subunit
MRRLLAIVLIGLCYFSCGKATDNIPSVPVNFSAPINDPRLAPLTTGGGVAFISGYGVAGLIIYRTGSGQYVAYDRCSSYQPEKKCAVTLDASGFSVTDPCSGSKFSLADGTPVKAPATKSLRAYSVSVYNFQIFVSN